MSAIDLIAVAATGLLAVVFLVGAAYIVSLMHEKTGRTVLRWGAPLVIVVWGALSVIWLLGTKVI